MSEKVQSTTDIRLQPSAQGLYSPSQEKDACGVGFIANMHGIASHEIVDLANTGLCNLAHRGAIDADAVTGDGAGLLTQIPYKLLENFLREKRIRVPEREQSAIGGEANRWIHSVPSVTLVWRR